MYAITGITGNVGGSVAHNLLVARRSVRAVMRDIGKGGCLGKARLRSRKGGYQTVAISRLQKILDAIGIKALVTLSA